MQKRIAIVTGASSDIGLAIVMHLLEAEYQVIAQVNKNRQKIESLAHQFPDLAIVQSDLSSSALAQSFIENHVHSSGVDVLINTIGPLLHKDLAELHPVEWENQIHLNLNLAFYLSYYAKKYLIESKGHIVNFTFAGAELLKARVETTAYCAAKAGLVVLTKSLAHIFAKSHVRVNAVAPGLVDDGVPLDGLRYKIAQEIPFGRQGTSSEIVEVVNWLLCKSPKYLTGALIPVAGAWEYL